MNFFAATFIFSIIIFCNEFIGSQQSPIAGKPPEDLSCPSPTHGIYGNVLFAISATTEWEQKKAFWLSMDIPSKTIHDCMQQCYKYRFCYSIRFFKNVKKACRLFLHSSDDCKGKLMLSAKKISQKIEELKVDRVVVECLKCMKNDAAGIATMNNAEDAPKKADNDKSSELKLLASDTPSPNLKGHFSQNDEPLTNSAEAANAKFKAERKSPTLMTPDPREQRQIWRACLVTFEVVPETQREMALREIKMAKTASVTSLNECAFICYQNACSNILFELSDSEEKPSKCHLDIESNKETCSPNLQRHYSYPNVNNTVVSCVRCVAHKPTTISPNAEYVTQKYASTIEESTNSPAQLNEISTKLATTIEEETSTKITTQMEETSSIKALESEQIQTTSPIVGLPTESKEFRSQTTIEFSTNEETSTTSKIISEEPIPLLPIIIVDEHGPGEDGSTQRPHSVGLAVPFRETTEKPSAETSINLLSLDQLINNETESSSISNTELSTTIENEETSTSSSNAASKTTVFFEATTEESNGMTQTTKITAENVAAESNSEKESIMNEPSSTASIEEYSTMAASTPILTDSSQVTSNIVVNGNEPNELKGTTIFDEEESTIMASTAIPTVSESEQKNIAINENIETHSTPSNVESITTVSPEAEDEMMKEASTTILAESPIQNVEIIGTSESKTTSNALLSTKSQEAKIQSTMATTSSQTEMPQTNIGIIENQAIQSSATTAEPQSPEGEIQSTMTGSTQTIATQSIPNIAIIGSEMNESNETSVTPETTISPHEAEIQTTMPASSSQKENSQPTNQSNATSTVPETTISPENEFQITMAASSSQTAQQNIAVIGNEASQSNATTSMGPESKISTEIEFQTTVAQPEITQTNIPSGSSISSLSESNSQPTENVIILGEQAAENNATTIFPGSTLTPENEMQSTLATSETNNSQPTKNVVILGEQAAENNATTIFPGSTLTPENEMQSTLATSETNNSQPTENVVILGEQAAENNVTTIFPGSTSTPENEMQSTLTNLAQMITSESGSSISPLSESTLTTSEIEKPQQPIENVIILGEQAAENNATTILPGSKLTPENEMQSTLATSETNNSQPTENVVILGEQAAENNATTILPGSTLTPENEMQSTLATSETNNSQPTENVVILGEQAAENNATTIFPGSTLTPENEMQSTLAISETKNSQPTENVVILGEQAAENNATTILPGSTLTPENEMQSTLATSETNNSQPTENVVILGEQSAENNATTIFPGSTSTPENEMQSTLTNLAQMITSESGSSISPLSESTLTTSEIEKPQQPIENVIILGEQAAENNATTILPGSKLTPENEMQSTLATSETNNSQPTENVVILGEQAAENNATTILPGSTLTPENEMQSTLATSETNNSQPTENVVILGEQAAENNATTIFPGSTLTPENEMQSTLAISETKNSQPTENVVILGEQAAENNATTIFPGSTSTPENEMQSTLATSETNNSQPTENDVILGEQSAENNATTIFPGSTLTPENEMQSTLAISETKNSQPTENVVILGEQAAENNATTIFPGSTSTPENEMQSTLATSETNNSQPTENVVILGEQAAENNVTTIFPGSTSTPENEMQSTLTNLAQMSGSSILPLSESTMATSETENPQPTENVGMLGEELNGINATTIEAKLKESSGFESTIASTMSTPIESSSSPTNVVVLVEGTNESNETTILETEFASSTMISPAESSQSSTNIELIVSEINESIITNETGQTTTSEIELTTIFQTEFSEPAKNVVLLGEGSTEFNSTESRNGLTTTSEMELTTTSLIESTENITAFGEGAINSSRTGPALTISGVEAVSKILTSTTIPNESPLPIENIAMLGEEANETNGTNSEPTSTANSETEQSSSSQSELPVTATITAIIGEEATNYNATSNGPESKAISEMDLTTISQTELSEPTKNFILLGEGDNEFNSTTAQNLLSTTPEMELTTNSLIKSTENINLSDESTTEFNSSTTGSALTTSVAERESTMFTSTTIPNESPLPIENIAVLGQEANEANRTTSEPSSTANSETEQTSSSQSELLESTSNIALISTEANMTTNGQELTATSEMDLSTISQSRLSEQTTIVAIIGEATDSNATSNKTESTPTSEMEELTTISQSNLTEPSTIVAVIGEEAAVSIGQTTESGPTTSPGAESILIISTSSPVESENPTENIALLSGMATESNDTTSGQGQTTSVEAESTLSSSMAFPEAMSTLSSSMASPEAQSTLSSSMASPEAQSTLPSSMAFPEAVSTLASSMASPEAQSTLIISSQTELSSEATTIVPILSGEAEESISTTQQQQEISQSSLTPNQNGEEMLTTTSIAPESSELLNAVANLVDIVKINANSTDQTPSSNLIDFIEQNKSIGDIRQHSPPGFDIRECHGDISFSGELLTDYTQSFEVILATETIYECAKTCFQLNCTRAAFTHFPRSACLLHFSSNEIPLNSKCGNEEELHSSWDFKKVSEVASINCVKCSTDNEGRHFNEGNERRLRDEFSLDNFRQILDTPPNHIINPQGFTSHCHGRVEFITYPVPDLHHLSNITNDVPADTPADCARKCYEMESCLIAGFIPTPGHESAGGICLITENLPNDEHCSATDVKHTPQHASTVPFLIECIRCTECNYTLSLMDSERANVDYDKILDVNSVGECAEKCAASNGCSNAHFDPNKLTCSFITEDFPSAGNCPIEAGLQTDGIFPISLNCVQCRK